MSVSSPLHFIPSLLLTGLHLSHSLAGVTNYVNNAHLLDERAPPKILSQLGTPKDDTDNNIRSRLRGESAVMVCRGGGGGRSKFNAGKTFWEQGLLRLQ